MLGSYPLNAIKREQIQSWVAQLTAAGKSPVTRAVSHGGTGFRARGGYALAVQHAGAHSSVGRVVRRCSSAGYRRATLSCQTRCRTPTPQGLLRVRRTIQPLNGALAFLAPKTKDSRRRVPLTAALGAMGRPAHAGNVIRLRG